MKRLAIFASVFIAGFTTAAAMAAEMQETIPKQFQGNWANSDSACAQGKLSESFLTIGPTQLRFYGSRSQLLAAAVEGDTELAVLLKASGEGLTWLDTAHFRLSANGQELTHIISRGLHESTRVRCSPN